MSSTLDGARTQNDQKQEKDDQGAPRDAENKESDEGFMVTKGFGFFCYQDLSDSSTPLNSLASLWEKHAGPSRKGQINTLAKMKPEARRTPGISILEFNLRL